MTTEGDVKMIEADLIEVELNVGMTRKQYAALEVAAACVGMKRGTWVRQAVVEKLVQQQILEHPAQQAIKAAAEANGGKTQNTIQGLPRWWRGDY